MTKDTPPPFAAQQAANDDRELKPLPTMKVYDNRPPVLGLWLGFDAKGNALVDYPGNSSGEPELAMILKSIREGEPPPPEGRMVQLVKFEHWLIYGDSQDVRLLTRKGWPVRAFFKWLNRRMPVERPESEEVSP